MSMNYAYAQNGEDIFLSRCFSDVKAGFYVDVGANSPVIDSVTFRFYQQGWRGVNVEPLPWRHRELERYRPRDINVRGVCGLERGTRTFNAVPGKDGLSSLLVENAVAADGPRGVAAFEVVATTLREIFERYAPAEVHFLKVDVEGAEREVLAGADWTRFRPHVLVIEATKPNSPERNSREWRSLLKEAEYERAYFDGLNEYYVSKERLDLRKRFKTPISVFDAAVPFRTFGDVFDDRRHPDHAWARSLAARYLRAGAVLGPSVDLAALTADLSPALLEQQPEPADVEEAYGRVLGRPPSPEDLAAAVALATVSDLYEMLIAKDEFLNRRARALPSR